MPRDGSNIYHLPAGTAAVTNTTIESAKYNAFSSDLEQDANIVRPIVAGGTGANNATDALSSLGAMRASQIVTNYDSQLWYVGSFYSAAGATSAPVAGHAFAGIAYSSDPAPVSPTWLPANLNVIVQARDQNDTTVPGRVYVREKKAGTWGPWTIDNGRTVVGTSEGIGVALGDMFFGVRGTSPASSFVVNNKADVSGTDLMTVSKSTGVVSFPQSPTAPTPTAGDSSTQLATTAFATTADNALSTAISGVATTAAGKVSKGGDTMTGQLSMPTPAGTVNSTEVVTAAWVRTYAQPANAQLFAGIPITSASGGYTTVATDAQKGIVGTGAVTINSALYTAGTVISFAGYGGTMTISLNTGTLYWCNAGSPVTGTRTLANTGIATAIKQVDGNWIISGNGLT